MDLDGPWGTKIKCFIDKLEAARELPLTGDIKPRDATSINHRVASKAEWYLLNYSTVIKAVKSPWCAEADIHTDYPTENMKGKTASFMPFQFRNSSAGGCHRGHVPAAGDRAPCPQPGLTAELRKGSPASRAEKFKLCTSYTWLFSWNFLKAEPPHSS